YFLNLTVTEMSKPQAAAQPDAKDRSPDGSSTTPQDARDNAAPDPVTMPHQTRDYTAPVRHESSLDPKSEPSLETSSENPVTFGPAKLKLSAAERQRAFKEGR